jgi:endonuclease YncB( thermonuclease family)
MQSDLPFLRRIRVPPALLLLSLACLTTGIGREPAQASPATLEGLVTRVADGDTLDVLDDGKASHRIRLLGIDAPEGGQPYGKVAKQALLDHVIRRRVTVLVQSKDRYHRSVGKVLLAGADINLEMVREGLVWHYKHYAGDQVPGDARRYAQAEQEARQARVGLWADPHPTPPWVWRRSHPRTPRP